MTFVETFIDPLWAREDGLKSTPMELCMNLDNIWKLEDLGFDEGENSILAQTNFSEEVYDNMRLAVKHIPTVTVETPRGHLIEKNSSRCLPIIQDMRGQTLGHLPN